MARKLAAAMSNFVPESYYALFMERRGKSLAQYPYMFIEYDSAVERHVPFCVFDLTPHEVNGQPANSFEITYKSVFSRTTFKRIIYA